MFCGRSGWWLAAAGSADRPKSASSLLSVIMLLYFHGMNRIRQVRAGCSNAVCRLLRNLVSSQAAKLAAGSEIRSQRRTGSPGLPPASCAMTVVAAIDVHQILPIRNCYLWGLPRGGYTGFFDRVGAEEYDQYGPRGRRHCRRP